MKTDLSSNIQKNGEEEESDCCEEVWEKQQNYYRYILNWLFSLYCSLLIMIFSLHLKLCDIFSLELQHNV